MRAGPYRRLSDNFAASSTHFWPKSRILSSVSRTHNGQRRDRLAAWGENGRGDAADAFVKLPAVYGVPAAARRRQIGMVVVDVDNGLLGRSGQPFALQDGPDLLLRKPGQKGFPVRRRRGREPHPYIGGHAYLADGLPLVDHDHLGAVENGQDRSLVAVVDQLLQEGLRRDADIEFIERNPPVFRQGNSQVIALGGCVALQDAMMAQSDQQLVDAAFMPPRDLGDLHERHLPPLALEQIQNAKGTVDGRHEIGRLRSC